MSARFLLILYPALLSHSLTVNEHADSPILSKTKVELKPLFISCRLNDIVTVTAPVVNTDDTLYYLTKPNGDTAKIHIKQPSYVVKHTDEYDNDIAVKHIKEDARSIIRSLVNYEILKADRRHNATNLEKRIDNSDITIGPLSEDDHGNWVLSVYYKDLDENWIELFQVITIEITETVPSSPTTPTIKAGAVFKPSFAYPIKDLESCEIIAPGSTFDRFYSRSNIELDRCGYVIDNVTIEDQGVWKIIGVGRIVYETEIYLKVLNKVT